MLPILKIFYAIFYSVYCTIFLKFSSLLTLVSSLLTLVVSRPLPLTQGVGSTRPPCSHVPLPPHQGGEGGSSVDPSGRSEFAVTPPHRISPSLGSESGPAGQVDAAVLPVKPQSGPSRLRPPTLWERARSRRASWVRTNSSASASRSSEYHRIRDQLALLG